MFFTCESGAAGDVLGSVSGTAAQGSGGHTADGPHEWLYYGLECFAKTCCIIAVSSTPGHGLSYGYIRWVY